MSALEEQEEDAGEEEEHEGPSSASVIKSPQRSSVKVSPLKRPAPKKYTIQSPRRRTVARVLSDDEAADDEQEAEEEEEQEEEDRFSLAPANEARGRPDKDAEVSESEGEEEEDIVMASDEDADAVEVSLQTPALCRPFSRSPLFRRPHPACSRSRPRLRHSGSRRPCASACVSSQCF